MSVVITVVVVLVLVALTMVGAWRDIRRAVTALAGTLLGALVSASWGDEWATQLVEHALPSNGNTISFVISSGLLVGIALLVGYGAGSFFPPHAGPLSFGQRVLGALLGLLTGVILTGYVLQYAVAGNPGFEALVNESPVTQFVLYGLPYLFLGMALLIAGAVALRALIVALWPARSAPTVALVGAGAARPAPNAAPPPQTPAEQQQNRIKALEKVVGATQKHDLR